MDANENVTTWRSRKESESCSRVRCWIPHYVLKVKDDKEEDIEVHSRFCYYRTWRVETIVVIGQTTDISEWPYNSVWWLDRLTKPKFIDHMRRFSHMAWIFQTGISYWVGSDRIFIIGLLSTAAWVAANQGMTPMEEMYEGILKKERWEVSRKKLLTSIWMLSLHWWWETKT